MVEPLRHRQTKGAETDMPSLPPPRHIPTLPVDAPFQARENVGIVAARGRRLDPETGRLWLQPTVRSPPSRFLAIACNPPFDRIIARPEPPRILKDRKKAFF